uniref:Uncharacterized protein n=1 Tax=Eutreptiella gymnastica TaxID=73025 RepID=A0A7S1IP25_9EUGL
MAPSKYPNGGLGGPSRSGSHCRCTQGNIRAAVGVSPRMAVAHRILSSMYCKLIQVCSECLLATPGILSCRDGILGVLVSSVPRSALKGLSDVSLTATTFMAAGVVCTVHCSSHGETKRKAEEVARTATGSVLPSCF